MSSSVHFLFGSVWANLPSHTYKDSNHVDPCVRLIVAATRRNQSHGPRHDQISDAHALRQKSEQSPQTTGGATCVDQCGYVVLQGYLTLSFVVTVFQMYIFKTTTFFLDHITECNQTTKTFRDVLKVTVIWCLHVPKDENGTLLIPCPLLPTLLRNVPYKIFRGVLIDPTFWFFLISVWSLLQFYFTVTRCFCIAC